MWNSEGKVGCGQFGQASWIFFSFASVAVFPLVFLFIVLCGGSIEGQVSTRENSLATYIAFPLLSTPGMGWFLVILWICSV